MKFNVQYLEENKKKKFAIIPYESFLELMELASDETDYEKALKVLRDKDDEIVRYDSSKILTSPITKMREQKQLSQAGLAKKLKVNPSYVSRLEKTGANPSLKTLKKVAKALDCSVEELL